MNQRTMRLAFPALVVVFAASGCDRIATNDPTAPVAPQAATVTDGSGVYTLIEGSPRTKTYDAVIALGPNGGSLTVAGHKLVVPAGAVDKPTNFSMAVKTDGFVAVSLRAWRPDGSGGSVDVGKQGFLKPVRLETSYQYATNVSDPSKLVNLWLIDGTYSGSVEAQGSVVDTRGKKVISELSHFSEYVVGSNGGDGMQ